MGMSPASGSELFGPDEGDDQIKAKANGHDQPEYGFEHGSGPAQKGGIKGEKGKQPQSQTAKEKVEHRCFSVWITKILPQEGIRVRLERWGSGVREI